MSSGGDSGGITGGGGSAGQIHGGRGGPIHGRIATA